MSVPTSLRAGPFTPTVLVKKRYLVFYIFLIWVSGFTVLLELWFYWQLLSAHIVYFWIFFPFLCLLAYFTSIFSSLVAAKLLLIIINIFHPPRTGIFMRHPSDRDYRYWSLRSTIKRWPIWLSHKFPFPFLDNICFKIFGVKTKFSNSLFEGWVDTEFIDFGKNVVIGQASIVQSAVIMGNFLIIRRTIIEDNVRIGAHCVVMPGTHIGKNCILGAESFTLVEQKLEDGWIYLGTPAKKFKRNGFFEAGLVEKIEEAQKDIDIEELRILYEKRFFQRHDKHISPLERLRDWKETKESEQIRFEKVHRDSEVK
ncbi:MAG: hypothetical protein GF353_27135 [Candidatus Lokiarchaeota archaeon]|nr:hypothetical protein [Candidatus Lokiarchaeota archaeon]